MLQVHYCLMYLSAGLSKLKGDSWWNGTAPWITMNNPEFSPVHIAAYRDFLSFLCHRENRWLWEVYMSCGVIFTLVMEIGFPFWCGRGCGLSLSPARSSAAPVIAVYMGLIVFSLFMSALLLCWMTPEAVRAVFARPPALLPKLRRTSAAAASRGQSREPGLRARRLGAGEFRIAGGRMTATERSHR